MDKKVHAQIEYYEGSFSAHSDISTHSDICPPDCNFNNIDNEYRDLLHQFLDEWLDNSNGNGGFYIKAEGFIFAPDS